MPDTPMTWEEMFPCPACGKPDAKVTLVWVGGGYEKHAVVCRCGACGRRMPSELEARKEWEGMARPTTWTAIMPTERGWYWMRRYKSCTESIVFVSSAEANGVVVYMRDTNYSGGMTQGSVVTGGMGYEWSSHPVQRPVDDMPKAYFTL